MKNTVSGSIFLFFALIGCEDVVDVDVPAEEPRLIIDALIRVDERLPLHDVAVKVGLTSNFFEVIPFTNLKQVTIINISRTLNNVLILNEITPNSGVYEDVTGLNFFGDGELVFQIDHNDRLYFARTRYIRTNPIDTLVQGDDFLFDEDETEIRVSFTDTPDEENYYVFDLGFGNYFTTQDEFYDGEQFQFSYFYDDKLEPGSNIMVSILAADQEFHNYMTLLIDQSSDELNIFSTPVATVRGNIFDVTELDNKDVFDNVDIPDNFPLGYFAIVQTDSRRLTIE